MVGRLSAGLGAEGLIAATLEARVDRFAAMGTRVELHQFGPGDPEALAAGRRAIEAVDDALTIHRPSPTTAMNDCLANGRSAPVDDPVLFDALVGVEAAWGATEGLFDPTVRRGQDGGRWPAISFDRRAGRIEGDVPCSLDFGGFGKGFALDRAGAAMRAAGVSCAFMSAGESSIAVIGDHPVGGAWPVAVPHPLVVGDWLIELELSDQSLSVSSTVGAGVAKPGRSAMVRPTDGAIITSPGTTIAIEPTGGAAEAMSTALLVAPDQAAQRLLARHSARRYRFMFADDLGAPLL